MEGKQLSVRVHMIVLPSLKYSRITDAKQIDSRIAIQSRRPPFFCCGEGDAFTVWL
jgi:hypothetical protein